MGRRQVVESTDDAGLTGRGRLGRIGKGVQGQPDCYIRVVSGEKARGAKPSRTGENPRIELHDIAIETGISESLVGMVIKEDLKLRKTPVKYSYVPKMLTYSKRKMIVLMSQEKLLTWSNKTFIGNEYTLTVEKT
ncbi:hypothetical protein LAZ67_X004642 [Cordylochernes scorpioides]|uniref:Uncharacterized protein n=1 Tax=Cordylochernes scorpioides TaxID=51811 RepID=A0ABY6LYF9_9ARAC|nr:hypothetical protein LAZ67_X004642 [Cordylochernes scorpioides]